MIDNDYLYFVNALAALAPGAEWIMRDESFSNIEWLSEDIPKPSLEDILAKKRELEEQSLQPTENPKATAIAKLQDLGLTEDEARAIAGV